MATRIPSTVGESKWHWSNLDRCPHCKVWISARNGGLCRNSHCKAYNHQVVAVKEAPLAPSPLSPAQIAITDLASYYRVRDMVEAWKRWCAGRGSSFEQHPDFVPIALKIRQALEALPLKTLQMIAYTCGFRYPLTADEPGSSRASALVYWLNPLYEREKIQLIQDKAIARFKALAETGQIEVLIEESKLHQKVREAAPDVVAKYQLPPAALDAALAYRLEKMGRSLDYLAFKLARQYGRDKEDIRNDLVERIITRAKEVPSFIFQAANFVLQKAEWMVKSQQRRAVKHDHGPLLVEDLPAPAGPLVSDVSVEMQLFSASLSEDLQELLALLLQSPDEFITASTGRINVTRLAKRAQKSWWSTEALVGQLEAALNNARGMFSLV